MNSHKLNSSKVLSRRYISHFTARDVEAQSSETLSIVSCIHVPLYTPLLPLQKAWKGDRKTLPRQAVPLDRFCRISEAEMSCTEHNQQSHRRAEDSSCHLKGTQLPTATTDKALHMATQKICTGQKPGRVHYPGTPSRHSVSGETSPDSNFPCWITWEQFENRNIWNLTFLWDSIGDICLPARAPLQCSSTYAQKGANIFISTYCV